MKLPRAPDPTAKTLPSSFNDILAPKVSPSSIPSKVIGEPRIEYVKSLDNPSPSKSYTSTWPYCSSIPSVKSSCVATEITLPSLLIATDKPKFVPIDDVLLISNTWSQELSACC